MPRFDGPKGPGGAGLKNFFSAVLLTLVGSTAVLIATAPDARSQASDQVGVRADVARMRSSVGPGGGAFGSDLQRLAAAARYDVVALRVEFQPDTSRFSTGTGTFDGTLFDTAPSIDPLPHDGGYFRAHLNFLDDYIARVSDGRTTTRSVLLPEIVRVSGTMGDYAPTGLTSDSDEQIAKLAALVGEAWQLADAQSVFDASGFDPDHTAFLIFHARVGRDIELTGTTLDKTPEDLPSLYFGPDALARFGVQATFRGMPVTNGLIIPRTETRQGFNFISDENFLAEFSINGLLAASFLNYLGAPDLFDTKTGQSAIGPFGVMDGLGIFAFNGLFPPEPSAWTKQFLGWGDVLDVDPGATAQSISLAHAGDRASSEMARIPVVPSADGASGVATGDSGPADSRPAEYFLVENRHRDPEGDGLVMTVWRDGQFVIDRFENGATGFNSNTISDFAGGVVVSVDNYDFALPGGLDENDVPLVGGALIWHIDERRIAKGLVDNSVNADAEARGVDLEEADSAQDIGYPSGGFFGPQFELGSPFDFWYEGNPVSVLTATGREIQLYANRFGPDTYPGTVSNDGGAGFVELSAFSPPASTMSLSYRRLSVDGISEEPLFSFSSDMSIDGNGLLRIVGQNGALVFVGDASESTLGVWADGVRIADVDGLLDAEPAVASGSIWALDGDGFVQVSGSGGVNRIGGMAPGTVASATTPVVAYPGPRGALLFAGASGAQGDVLVQISPNGGAEAIVQPEPIIGLAFVDDDLAVVSESQARIEGRNLVWNYPPVLAGQRVRPLFGRDREGVMGVVPDPAGDQLHVLIPGGVVYSIQAPDPGQAFSGQPSIADVDQDGLLDIVVARGNTIWAFGRAGAVASGFPVVLRGPTVGPPLIAAGETAGEVMLVATADGFIEGVDLESGRRLQGFPLSFGLAAGAPAVLTGHGLSVLSVGGVVATWSVYLLGAPIFGEPMGSPANGSFVEVEGDAEDFPDVRGLFVPSETYVWPNPVEDGVAHFRVQPAESARVEIDIVDPAGRQIDRLLIADAPEYAPSEVRWQADVPSGLYIARIRVTTLSGDSESRLVKFAVIR